ncbi:MAG TPA: tryptophan 2,3-dioxygenase family protein, partial [Mycobacteriales bacterium]|nr:tryptophan 2,3-dioxygenase family protein [Mycobacteriales bacterium]
MSERSASVGSPDGSGLDGAPGDGDPGVPDRAGSVPPPSDTRFGEQGGLLTYGSYLRLEGLLGQQQLESVPPAHDELLFITIHQVYELWFNQLLHELVAARDGMLAGETYLPRTRL